MDNLYIIVPAYNESENIEAFIKEWYPIVVSEQCSEESRLVIISDGSTDNTYSIVKNYEERMPYLIALEKENTGHGGTLIYGYQFAIQNGADFVFQTDSDRQTTPDEFKQFWEVRDKYDAVIGSRKNRKDGIQRIFVEKVLLFMIFCFFGVKVPDANAPYRLMKADLLEKYIGRMPADYNIPNVMLTVFWAFYQEKVKFIEITFKPRQKGKNSINIKKIIKIGLKSINDFLSFKKNMNKNEKNI